MKEKGSRIYIDDDSYTVETSEVDPEDSWSRASTQTTHHIRDIYLNGKSSLSYLDLDFKPEEDKKYFLLYALYSTGDSFGTDEGQIEFIDLFKTREDAEGCKEILENANEDTVKLKSASGKDWKFSVPWSGYFEKLESLVIQPFIL